jgi:hypothetical protein
MIGELKYKVMKSYTSIFVLVVLMIATSVEAQEELVAYWSFDKVNEDTIFDESAYTSYGINYGAGLVEGIDGSGLFFDGKDDYVRISHNGQNPPEILSNLGKGSVSLWFKANHIPVDYGIAPIFYYGMKEKCDFFDAANKGLIIELGHSPIHDGSERLYFTIWKNGCTFPSFCYDSGSPIPEDKWHHLVVVVGEDYNTGYLNGEEMVNRRYNFGTASYSQFFADAIAHERLWLGKGHWDGTTQYFKGTIDELRIYNKPLSEAEVRELFGSVSTTSSLSPNEQNENIRVYPNPSSDRLYYNITNSGKKVQNMKLIDAAGRIVIQNSEVSARGTLNINKLPEGVYSVVFNFNKGRFQKKIVIAR